MNSTNSLTLASSTTVSLDGFSDLVANKMVALVERGAPQDFLDIYTLCYEGLTTASRCWQLWKVRQESNGHMVKIKWAKMAVLNHVAQLGQAYASEEIVDPIEPNAIPIAPNAISHIQLWFQTDFLEAL